MLDLRLSLLHCAASCIPLAGCCTSAAGEDLIAYDFQGYRARVAGEISDPRNWSPDQTPARVDWISSYDGRIWGTDPSNFAAMWVDGTRAAQLAVPWMCFDAPSGDHVQFPARTRFMGRTHQFGWNGFCHLVVDVFLDGDPEWPHFWQSIRTGQQIFGFTTDPAGQFADETNGTRRKTSDSVGDWSHFSFMASSDDFGGVRQDLWVHAIDTAPAEDGVGLGDAGIETLDRWVYSVRTDNSTLIYSFRVRQSDSFEPHLPKVPADLIHVACDVDGIERAPFRDHTELGAWPKGKVIYENDTLVDRVRRQWETRGASLVGSAVIGLVGVAVCFGFHIFYLRSVQS